MQYVIEIIKSLGWPHLVFIFALIFLFMFKAQIGAFLSRVRSVGKEGIKADQLPESQYEEGRKKVVEELMSLPDSQLLREVEDVIKSDLKKRGLETEGDTIKVLIRHLAATRIAYGFEQTYNSIFGSQIYLLKQLHQVAGEGLAQEYVQDYFNSVKALYAEQFKTWDVNQYLRYLFAIEFVTLQNNKYHITVKGAEFLVWLARFARAENRPL